MRRLTVRIPDDLYQRFFAFADGRTFHRGDTQLADSVRDALAHYLACPHKRQTRNGTVSTYDTIEPALSGTDNQQTHNRQVPSVPLGLAEPLPLVYHNEQTSNSTYSFVEPYNGSLQQTENTPPAPLDVQELDTMPLEPEPVTVAPTSEDTRPVVPGPPFNARVYFLQPPGPCGHASHGADGNLVKRTTRACKLCEDAKAAEKKAAKAHRPAPVATEE